MAKNNLASMFAPVENSKGGGRLPFEIDMDLEANTLTATMAIPEGEIANFASGDKLAERFGTTDKGNSTIASERETVLRCPDGTEVLIMVNVFAKRPSKK